MKATIVEMFNSGELSILQVQEYLQSIGEYLFLEDRTLPFNERTDADVAPTSLRIVGRAVVGK